MISRTGAAKFQPFPQMRHRMAVKGRFRGKNLIATRVFRRIIRAPFVRNGGVFFYLWEQWNRSKPPPLRHII
jgi:hypothetical protein